jgi:hypothetical protein
MQECTLASIVLVFAAERLHPRATLEASSAIAILPATVGPSLFSSPSDQLFLTPIRRLACDLGHHLLLPARLLCLPVCTATPRETRDCRFWPVTPVLPSGERRSKPPLPRILV